MILNPENAIDFCVATPLY